jgi:predicted XRE-type DNA-binding protein
VIAHRGSRVIARKAVTVTRRAEKVTGSRNVFRDVGFREPEARTLALRSELMIRIEESVSRSGLTEARTAARLGLTQRKLSALLKGRIDRFTLDALVIAATRAGLRVDLRVTRGKRSVERVVAIA